MNKIKQLFGLTVLSIALLACKNSEKITDFEGIITYQIKGERYDTASSDSLNYQVIYAKDSMMRIDNFTTIGKQTYIKHIEKNKAYILMEIEGKKFAIQNIPGEIKDADLFQYTPQKKHKKIAGLKAQSTNVRIPEIDSVFVMYFYPNIPKKYSEAMPNMPGLPAFYTILSNGEFLDFEAVKVDETDLNIDIFGIPNDYKKISMDDFVKLISNKETIE